MRSPRVLLTILVVCILAGSRSAAAPGDLDLSFGGTGVVTTNLGASFSYPVWAGQQTDGRIVVVGRAGYSAGIFLVRYGSDGVLDTSYGGIRDLTNSLPKNSPFDLVDGDVAPDGTLLLLGRVEFDGASRAVVLRYLPDGTSDLTLQGTGLLVPKIGGTATYPSSLAGLPNGDFLVTAQTVSGQKTALAVARFHANGNPDRTFNGTGVATVGAGVTSYPWDLAIQSDGKIVIGATVRQTAKSPWTFLAARLLSNGKLDDAFNMTGWAEASVGASTLFSVKVAVQNDGSILLAGTGEIYDEGRPGIHPELDTVFAGVRFTASGERDPTFQFEKLRTLDQFAVDRRLLGMAIQADGKIVVAGAQLDGNAIICERYLPNGRFDPAWRNGWAEARLTTAPYTSYGGLFLLQDGRPAIFGVTSHPQAPDYAPSLACFRIDGAPFLEVTAPSENILIPAGGHIPVAYTLTGPTKPYKMWLEFYRRGRPLWGGVLASARETAGAHAFQVPIDGGPYDGVWGHIIEDGDYEVVLAAVDLAGRSTRVARLGITVDRQPPIVGQPPDLDIHVSEGTWVADYGTWGPIAGAASITYNPPAGTALTTGIHPVEMVVRDAAGNTVTRTFSVRINQVGSSVAATHHQIVALQGDLVRLDGADPRISEGARWRSFGLPTLNDAGTVAFVGAWRNQQTTGVGTGLFVGDRLLIKTSETLPDGGPGKVISIGAPSYQGNTIATIVTLAGPGITPLTNKAIIRADLSAPQLAVTVIARAGEIAPGTTGARIKGFRAVGLSPSGASLAFEGTLALASGTPGVRSGQEVAMWMKVGNEPVRLCVQQGMPIGFGSYGQPINVRCLRGALGSPGHNRMWLQDRGNSADLLTMLQYPAAAFLSATPPGLFCEVRTADGGGVTPIAGPGNFSAHHWSARSTLPSALLNGLGSPALAPGDRLGFTATLSTQFGNVEADETKGIFIGNPDPWAFNPSNSATARNYTLVARSGHPAPGLDGVTFHTFRDPVLSQNGALFEATLAGAGVNSTNDSSLWLQWGAEEPTLLAREGAPAAGMPAGVVWGKFTSVALADGPGPFGLPLFEATTRSTDRSAAPTRALWAVDGAGVLRPIVQKGVPFDSSYSLHTFNVMGTASGNPIQCYNRGGEVVWRGFLQSRRSGIFKTRTAVATPAGQRM